MILFSSFTQSKWQSFAQKIVEILSGALGVFGEVGRCVKMVRYGPALEGPMASGGEWANLQKYRREGCGL